MGIKILMIDDHPSQIEGYKVILSYNQLGHEIEVTPCYSFDSAYQIITNPVTPAFDLVFLDRSLPPDVKHNINTGEDLVSIIKKHLPQTRIVVITSHAEAFLLYDIVRKWQPAGVLVKSDFDAPDLLSAFRKILNGERYLSQTVEKCIKELLSKESYLDNYNRQIIVLLSQGVKTKSLPKHLNISLSAIEKRKSQVKDYLCIEKGSDEDIVREARRLGFI